jgi:hypothetical protein
MFTKAMIAATLAVFLGTTAVATAQPHHGGYGSWSAGQYGYAYGSPRGAAPTNTNGGA